MMCFIVFLYFCCYVYCVYFFLFKQKTAYEMRISDWSSDVCSSDLATSNCELMVLMTAASNAASRKPVISGWNSVLASRMNIVSGSASEIGRASCRERVCQYV